MKNFFLLAVLFVCLCGCSEQQLTREYGGTMTVNLPAGQELMEATWKHDDLFYLTRPMDDDYVPVTKTFQESSAWGVMETTVYFVETR